MTNLMHPVSVSSSLFVRLISLFALGSALSLHAQQSPAADANPAEPKQEENQVVVLSAFEVSTKATNEYVASESVTGTRIASQLRDLPFQVNVITAEFMNDFAAYEMPDQLGFVSNISPSESQGEFQLRGFPSTPFVDGFRRLGNVNIVNTQRVEVIKGLAASIYGQVLPGGVVNYITRKPGSKKENKIDFSVGSDAFRRVNASTTGPAGSSGKFFHRVDLSSQKREFFQNFADRDTLFGSLQLLYKPSDQTSVNVKLDYNSTYNHDPYPLPWIKTANGGGSTTTARGALDANGNQLQYRYVNNSGVLTTVNAPAAAVVNRFTNHPDDIAGYLAYIANPTPAGFQTQYGQIRTVSSSWDGLDYSLADARLDGWGGYSESELVSGTVTADHKWNSVFSSRATLDYYDRTYNRQRNNNNQVTYNETIATPTSAAYLDGKLGVSAPQYQTADSHALTAQLDTLAQFRTGPLKHKLLLTLDFADQSRYDQALRVPMPTINSPVASDDQNSVIATTNGYYVTNTRLGYPVSWPLTVPGGAGSTGNGRLVFPWTNDTFAFPLYQDFPGLYTLGTEDKVVTNTDLGLFMSERISFWDDRVTLLLGARQDWMRNTAINYLDATPRRVVWNTKAFTHQIGLSANLTKNLVIFANDSSTYNPNPQTATNRQTQELMLFPNEEGSGYEYGFRIAAFDKRVNVGVSFFNITRENKLDSYTNEFGETEYVADGTQVSKGYEIDFNVQITEGLQMIGGYGYNDARYTYASLPYLIDQTTPRSPTDNLGVAFKYQFKNGKLKGLSFTAGVRYLSESLVSLGSGGTLTTNPYGPSETSSNGFTPIIYNNPLYNGALPFPDLPQGIVILSANNSNTIGFVDPTTGRRLQDAGANRGYVTSNRTGNQILIPAGWVAYTPGMTMVQGTQYYLLDGDGVTGGSYHYTTQVDDGRSRIFNNGYTLWEFGAQYSFRTHNRKLRHSVRLNLKNAFDEFYTYGAGVLGDPRQLICTYSVTF